MKERMKYDKINKKWELNNTEMIIAFSNTLLVFAFAIVGILLEVLK